MSETCMLCSNQIAFYKIGKKNSFFACPDCELVFKPSEARPSAKQEKARYDTHQNTIENNGYVQFLKPVMDIVMSRAPGQSKGLDYGCGPQPVLAQMLTEQGFEMSFYDPFYFPDGLSLNKKFDFITCTEAAEHFFNPRLEFERIFSMLTERGIFVVMTELYNEDIQIDEWYYSKDPTHVCFFTKNTMQWIARKFNRQHQILSSRLAVFH